MREMEDKGTRKDPRQQRNCVTLQYIQLKTLQPLNTAKESE